MRRINSTFLSRFNSKGCASYMRLNIEILEVVRVQFKEYCKSSNRTLPIPTYATKLDLISRHDNLHNLSFRFCNFNSVLMLLKIIIHFLFFFRLLYRWRKKSNHIHPCHYNHHSHDMHHSQLEEDLK